MDALHAIVVLCAVMLALCSATDAALAEPPAIADPCASPSFYTKAVVQRSTPIVRLEHDTATFIGKHVQRACRLIEEILRDPQIQHNKKLEVELHLIIDALRREVLAPIYHEYRELRRQDLTSVQTVPLAKTDHADVDSRSFKERSASKQMGPATALYLHRTLTRTQTRLARISEKLSCGDESHNECLKALNISAEVNFAGAPVYLNYPRLWRLTLQEGMMRASMRPRTARSDLTFRSAAPPLGSVRLTPAASSYLREMLDSIRRQVGNRCIVATIGWIQGMTSKGPNDADWKVTGPGLEAGTFSCAQVPPDVVRTIDGIRIVFAGDDASRFAGKIVDRENGVLIVKDR